MIELINTTRTDQTDSADRGPPREVDPRTGTCQLLVTSTQPLRLRQNAGPEDGNKAFMSCVTHRQRATHDKDLTAFLYMGW